MLADTTGPAIVVSHAPSVATTVFDPSAISISRRRSARFGASHVHSQKLEKSSEYPGASHSPTVFLPPVRRSAETSYLSASSFSPPATPGASTRDGSALRPLIQSS